MAHLYDNFDDAFAAFSSDWIINQDLHIQGRGWADDAYNEGNSPVLLYEFQALALSVMNMYNLIWNLFDIREIAPDQSDLYESLYWAGQPAEVTVKGILEAWAADDFKGAAPTIAFIDRMRQLIWDEPYFVQWAARPFVPE